MDDTLILTNALHLATLLRDSASGAHWRDMRQRIRLEARSAQEDSNVAGTPSARLLGRMAALTVKAAFRERPILMPYFLERTLGLSRTEIEARLSLAPALKTAQGALYECLQVTAAIIGLLRRLGHGYPYATLPYVVPVSAWCFIEKVCEVPWQLSLALAPPRPLTSPASFSTILTAAGLDEACLFAGDTARVDEAVAALISSVQESKELRDLNAAFSSVASLGLLRELALARAEFDTRYAALLTRTSAGEERDREAFVLVLELYYSRNRVIRNFIEAFERYEALLQRIYWIVQHVVFEEAMSCLSTVKAQQLQQAMLVVDRDDIHVTAIASTLAKTLQSGQLVHVTLPEFGHAYDGIYQVLRWKFEWHVRSGARAFTRAIKRWALPEHALSSLNTNATGGRVFVPSEEDSLMKVVNGAAIGRPNEAYSDSDIMTPVRVMSPSFTIDNVFGYPYVP